MLPAQYTGRDGRRAMVAGTWTPSLWAGNLRDSVALVGVARQEDTAVMAKTPTGPLAAGLVILGLLSVFDVVSPIVFPAAGPDEPGPPAGIVLLGVALGLVSLALIALLILGRGRGRGVAVGLVGCRVLSALIAVPAFFVSGVPGWIVVTVAVFIALTAVGCVLIGPALRGRTAPIG